MISGILTKHFFFYIFSKEQMHELISQVFVYEADP